MARVEVHEDRLVIRLSASERVTALRGAEIVLSREAISSAVITEDPWVWIRGFRSPGTHLPRRLAMGTWRSSAGRDLVLVRSGRSAVVLDFKPDESGDPSPEFDHFARVIISTTHAADLVRALRVPGIGGVYRD